MYTVASGNIGPPGCFPSEPPRAFSRQVLQYSGPNSGHGRAWSTEHLGVPLRPAPRHETVFVKLNISVDICDTICYCKGCRQPLSGGRGSGGDPSPPPELTSLERGPSATYGS